MLCKSCPPQSRAEFERHHLCGQVDVAVVTILEKEERAARDILKLEGAQTHWFANDQHFTYGKLLNNNSQNIRVAIFGVRVPGNTYMAAFTTLIHTALRPRLSILLGIAAGLETGNYEGENVTGVLIGEILLPDKILDFSFAVVQGNNELAANEVPRHEPYPIPVLSRSHTREFTNEGHDAWICARNEYMIKINNGWNNTKDSFRKSDDYSENQWRSLLNSDVADTATLQHSNGQIASSNLLLRNPDVLRGLHIKRDKRVKGADMESAGFAVASNLCKAEWMVIRGISDLGNPQKTDVFHDYASANAAAYLLTFLKFNVDLNLLKSLSSTDALLAARKQRSEKEVTSVLETFATIFKDQLGRPLNLEIYWKGTEKCSDGSQISGVKRNGNMKAERCGGLNRFQPLRFFPFSPKDCGEPKAVARCVGESDVDEVLHLIDENENTPLKWAYAVAIFSRGDHSGKKIGAICCTSTTNLFQETDDEKSREQIRFKLKAMVGLLRDILMTTFESTDTFSLLDEDIDP